MKKLLISLAALSLTGCGFAPVHAPAGSAAPNFKSIQVEIATPENVRQEEGGYMLQQHIYDRLGKNSGRHVLTLDPSTSRRPYGLTSNDVASRFDMIMTVDYVLTDSVSGDTLDKGEVRAVTTFGASRDPYARISSEKTATDQVAREASDRIITRLAAYYNKSAP